MTEKFNLSDKKALNTINNYVDFVSDYHQNRYYQNGHDLRLIKNRYLVNTAVKLASKTICYHEIPANDINNLKKYAHVCFWMLRIEPISYITKESAKGLVNLNPLKQFGINIKNDVKEINLNNHQHCPVNAETSLMTYMTLALAHKVKQKEDIPKHFKSIIASKYYERILDSIRYHNYSSRSLAMMLESLFQDKIYV